MYQWRTAGEQGPAGGAQVEVYPVVVEGMSGFNFDNELRRSTFQCVPAQSIWSHAADSEISVPADTVAAYSLILSFHTGDVPPSLCTAVLTLKPPYTSCRTGFF